MKDDEEYYVQMAQAWLICDLAVFNPKEVISFLENSKLKYNILGKAIQKMVDSYRISDEDKAYVKSLRNKLKAN
jgi:3-methyladenine DNA glycosylase AlkD